MVLHRNGKNNKDGSFDWVDAVCDAGIMAGLTFFTTLGSLGLTGLADGTRSVLAALIASGAQFFAILSLKRGLRKEG